MGEAKRRGSQVDRVKQAQARIEALKPEKLLCNECDGETTEIAVLDSRGVPGIEAVFGGTCPKCKGDILAIRGSPEAAQALLEAFQSETGVQGTIGVQGKSGR